MNQADINEKPVILALDSAMAGCSAAVRDGNGQSFAETVPMARGQSEQLVPMMNRVMSQAGVTYGALSLVAVTIGPGAFTGLRIGLAAARALGVTLGVPVAGVTTMETLAKQYTPQAKGRFAVLLETKREDFYIQFFSAEGQAISEPGGHTHAEIFAMLEPGDSIIGDALERFSSFAESAGPEAIVSGFELPDPRIITEIALEQWLSGCLKPTEPMYLREADVSQAKTKARQIEGFQDSSF